MEVSGEVTREVTRVIIVLNGEMRRKEIQDKLQLKDDENFRLNYINPTLESELIELVYPDTSRHPKQKYRLTKKGLELKEQLTENSKE